MNYQIRDLTEIELLLIAACVVVGYDYDLQKTGLSLEEWRDYLNKQKLMTEKAKVDEEKLQKAVEQTIRKVVKRFLKPEKSATLRLVENKNRNKRR